MKEIFLQIASKYTANATLAQALWAELEKNYSGKKRHYHNLEHIRWVYELLLPHQAEIKDWDALACAVFYHDAVYDVLKKDNEARSAALAEKRLRQMGFPELRTILCQKHILATQKHERGEHPDTNWLTDADLSILGSDQETYAAYTQKIRREYSIYPDLLYKPGRRKALAHFLGMDFIFKTPVFRERFEGQARDNLRREMSELA